MRRIGIWGHRKTRAYPAGSDQAHAVVLAEGTGPSQSLRTHNLGDTPIVIGQMPQTTTVVTHPLLSLPVIANARPMVRGKFIFVGNEKFYVRGVTYGPFCPDEDGSVFHTPDIVEQDFAQMAASGINAVRTCTVPPSWFSDSA